MASMSVLDIAVLGALALVISVLVVWLAALFGPAPAPPDPQESEHAARRFLFRDGALIDTDAPGFLLPEPVTADEEDWARFCRWLVPRFADPGPVETDTSLRLQARDGGEATLSITRQGATIRAKLADPGGCAVSHHELHRCLAETEAHRTALAEAPMPVWQRAENGSVLWENAAAAALPEAERAPLLAASGPGRIATQTPPRWYDLAFRPAVGGAFVYASDVTAIVEAEHARRAFVQTIGRTFGDLPTGLAIFDRDRTLAMFNPALTDLTGLDPVHLSGRPDILGFFDTLRNRQVMPEPKSYASWRDQIHAMIRAADQGQYQEVWSLVNGLTYRVTGRPHPDGAVAFLFDNISDQIAATRDQRAALDLRQAALDRMVEGVAVLSGNGTLRFCNRRFAILLRLAPEHRAGLSLADLLETCRTRLGPDPLWQEIAARMQDGAAPALRERVALDRGGALTVRLMPLGQGQAMLSLMPDPALAPPAALSA